MPDTSGLTPAARGPGDLPTRVWLHGTEGSVFGSAVSTPSLSPVYTFSLSLRDSKGEAADRGHTEKGHFATASVSFHSHQDVSQAGYPGPRNTRVAGRG